MKIADIASEVYNELGSPTDFSIPVVAYWLRANIGLLNASINTQYYVNPVNLEIEQIDPNSPFPPSVIEIGEDEKAVIKLMFTVHYYDIQIRKNMLNYNLRPIVEITSDGHSIRTLSQTEVGKNLYMFRKGIAEEMQQYISWYKISHAIPLAVCGDDYIAGPSMGSRPILRRAYQINDAAAALGSSQGV